MDVLITVDTEADNQWDPSPVVSTANLGYIPRFQSLAAGYGLKPTYLCTYEVVEAEAIHEVLRPWQVEGQAEIGAHLHPWTNPPLAAGSRQGIDEAAYPAFPSELSLETFRRKLRVLTERIETRTGVRPTSYRAGRWGFAASHTSVLEDLGYTADCSVTPLVSWDHARGVRGVGPDYRRAPVGPYYLDHEDVCRPGRSSVLEVPVTIVLTNRLMRRHEWLRTLLLRNRSRILVRALNRLFQLDPRWFRPYPTMSAAALIEVCDTAGALGLPVVEMMFHSSELMPGGSPYHPDAPAIDRLYEVFDEVFGYLRKQGCRGVTLREFATNYRVRTTQSAPRAVG